MRSGRANAASGRIMVTTPQDHFGPIPPEHDPRGTVSVATRSCPRRKFFPSLYMSLLVDLLVAPVKGVAREGARMLSGAHL